MTVYGDEVEKRSKKYGPGGPNAPKKDVDKTRKTTPPKVPPEPKK